jgi:hypothetical protein
MIAGAWWFVLRSNSSVRDGRSPMEVARIVMVAGMSGAIAAVFAIVIVGFARVPGATLVAAGLATLGIASRLSRVGERRPRHRRRMARGNAVGRGPCEIRHINKLVRGRSLTGNEMSWRRLQLKPQKAVRAR